MDKPRNVVLAVNLVWASIAIGLIVGLFTRSSVASPFGAWFPVVVVVLTAAVMSFFNCMVSAGKNWARITTAVVCILGLPWVVEHILQRGLGSVRMISMLVNTVLQLYSLYLVFTKPASAWFHKPKAQPDSSTGSES